MKPLDIRRPPAPTNGPGLSLDDLINRLAEGRQRATYGAVASLYGLQPRLLMRSRPRCRVDSWVVSKATGLPTGYEDEDLDPDLETSPRVIATGAELADWLQASAPAPARR